MIEIYTDGSCKNNGQQHNIGAYGFIVVENNQIIGKKVCKEYDTTNQRCELMGLIEACKYIIKTHPFDSVKIHTDSSYCYNCKQQKWYKNWEQNGWKTAKKSPVINRDLWVQLTPYFENSNLEFIKVPGHADNKYNNIIDALVQNEAKE